MLKFYECKVCEVPCIGMPHDGAIYEKEVCSPECLAQLAVCPTPLALDGGDSAASEQLSTPEVLSTLQGESTPAHRK